ncbi:DDE_3 domain-containing protein [Trichonephila clavipes]|nr:DDE_3 domain-containing protein [Trichonephila clavipes]
MSKKQTTATNAAADLNQHLDSTVSMITIRRRPHTWNICERAIIPKPIVPDANQEGKSVLIWAAVLWFSDGKEESLGRRVEIFKDDNAPIHAAGLIQSRFDEREKEVKHLPWPAQSPELSINKTLWSLSERSIRNLYPPPTSLPHLSQHVYKEWYNIL